MKRYDVVLIGYGPVGATLANLLGIYGLSVAVVEKEPDIFPIPRAVHIDDEAQRIWQAADLLDFVTPAFGGYPPDRQYINARGRVYFETTLSDARPFGFQTHMYFHQPLLEQGLRRGVDRFDSIDHFLGFEAVKIEQDAQSVKVEIASAKTGLRQTLSSHFLVGVDGARSFVRRAVGINLIDLKFDQPWLVTDFYLKEGVTREDVGFPYAHQQICDPKQPISFIPNGKNGHYRFEFMLTNGISKAEAQKPAFVHEKLSQVVDLSQIDIVRGAVYTFHSLIAARWRVGRVLIAGDAAHQMPPFAGQGMCSGLRDAHNLAWKLAFVVQNRAAERLLDSYEQERKPHVTRMTRGAMFLGNLVQTKSAMRAMLRDILFQTLFKIPALFGRVARFALRAPALDSAVKGGDRPALVGQYFIQPMVTLPTGVVIRLDDLLGLGFSVIGLKAGLGPDFAEVDQQGLDIKFLTIGQTFEDHTRELTDWFTQNRAEFVIIRPDRYIFAVYASASIGPAMAELKSALNHELVD